MIGLGVCRGYRAVVDAPEDARCRLMSGGGDAVRLRGVPDVHRYTFTDNHNYTNHYHNLKKYRMFNFLDCVWSLIGVIILSRSRKQKIINFFPETKQKCRSRFVY